MGVAATLYSGDLQVDRPTPYGFLAQTFVRVHAMSGRRPIVWGTRCDANVVGLGKGQKEGPERRARKKGQKEGPGNGRLQTWSHAESCRSIRRKVSTPGDASNEPCPPIVIATAFFQDTLAVPPLILDAIVQIRSHSTFTQCRRG